MIGRGLRLLGVMFLWLGNYPSEGADANTIASHNKRDADVMNQKPIARGHHYISQCYLKGFAKKPCKEAKLHVFDLRRGEWLPGAIGVKNVGKMRDFNTVDLAGVAADALETSLSQFESDVARVLRRIWEQHTLPQGEDWQILIGFMALLAVRNPLCREAQRDYVKQVLEMLTSMTLASKDRYESSIRQMREVGVGLDLPHVPYEEMLRFHQEKHYDVSIKNHFFFPGEFEAVSAVQEALLERKWLCLISDGKSHFLSGDRPVNLRWIDQDLAVGHRPPGHALLKTEVVFPVSKDVALVGTFEGFPQTAIADRLLVSKINSLIMTGCDRHLFSPRDNFDFFGSGGRILPASDFSREFVRRHSAD